MFSIFLLIGFTACKPKQPTHPPFWDEIQAFKKADSIQMPLSQGILFVGSSSFRYWTEIETVFKSYKAINRGFGGSSLLDLTYYVNDIVIPYNPRQILIYSGENDLGTDTVSAKMVLERFTVLFTKIRKKLPEAHVAYVSIKPSPGRAHLLPVIRESNKLIKSFLATQTKTQFIDVFPLLLTPDRKLRKDIYREDRLHMNDKGYEIWVKAIRPYLIKE